MKLFRNIFFMAVAGVIFAGCHKVKDLPHYEDGHTVELSANKSAVIATAADSVNAVIAFSWTSPEYSIDSNTARYVVEIDSTGKNFVNKTTKTVIGVRNTTLTGKELNNIMLNYGYAIGTAYNMDVRVSSAHNNNNEKFYSNIVKVAVTPYRDSSVLSSTQTSVTLAMATAGDPSLTFNWTRSFNGYTGNITYVLQYDSANKNFVAPVEIPIGVNLLTKGMTQAEMNATALNSGIPGGNSGRVEYRIKATTAQGAVAFSNRVFVTIQSYVPILRFYLPGSYQAAGGYGNDWTPGTAPELVRDLRSSVFNDMYYIYIYLPANAEFKVTQGRSWDVNYGGTGGNLVPGSPNNLKVTTAGVYRVSINRTTLKYDIREGRMGFIGDGAGVGWDAATVFPTHAMGAPATNLFVGLHNFTTAGGQWKMIDGSAWNSGSNLTDETRSYGANGPSGTTMEVNGSNNFPAVPGNGRYRVIWDGRNVDDIKYHMSPATEMRLVGDGINVAGVNDWDPPTSPQMTYNGNGVWQITVALRANKDIKFLAGNAWGAFDYEDASGQSQATGTPRKIVWDSNVNFKTPTVAGTYTITLNELTQTVTIN